MPIHTQIWQFASLEDWLQQVSLSEYANRENQNFATKLDIKLAYKLKGQTKLDLYIWHMEF